VLDPKIPITPEMERYLEDLRSKGVSISRIPPPEGCISGLHELEQEREVSRTASNRVRASMSLQKQYEQEMYFAEARMKLIDRSCRDGKVHLYDHGYRTAADNLEMNRKACAIVAKDCKPRKHW
jgi:hypothetical protein